MVRRSVLITGESGVGKEVVATRIHRNSRRANGPMVPVNCAALPPNLVESELFGHEKGAFTGAAQRRIGRFEKAHRGTIFLDEIAEIQPDIQVKLPRGLQERPAERVGGGEPVPIHLHIPPLRERKEDILYLAHLFLECQASETGISVKNLSAGAETYLPGHSFPGNVRELKNTLERAIVLGDGPRIMARDPRPLDNGMVRDDADATLKESVEAAEREAILDALRRHHWTVTAAARVLGISGKNLWEKMKRYGISKDTH